MDFKLTDEQVEFRKLAREFGAREMAPVAESCDKHPERAEGIYKKVFESGLMNVQLPEANGGLGLPLWDAVLIAEGLAQGCSSIYAAIECSAMAQIPLLVAGTTEQQKHFLEPLSESVAFAGISSDALFGRKGMVTAVRQGDSYILNGSCPQLFNCETADWFVILALDPASEARLYFVVPKKSEGLSLKERYFSVGRKCSAACSAALKEVKLSGEYVLTNGQAENSRRKITASVQVMAAAGMVGVAQSAFENAKRYAGERYTFGKPIAQHQGIAFMMADMAKDIEAARELTWQAAILIDKGDPSSRASISALTFASEMVMRVTTDAVQVYGGYGYSKEYPVEKLMRDAKSYQCFIPSSLELKAALGRQLLLV
jgi:acyl-CoA dehydrogenase